jgi:pimeloyl-ACP methyl ester carboxylesterase
VGDLELPRAEDGLAPDRTLSAAGIVVRQWGGDDGIPLLFWPGLSPFGDLQLVEAGPALADRGHLVLAIAAPGAGDTPPLDDPEEYRPSRLADRAVAVADELGLERFAFAGASWGASIGVHLASRHPERVSALVLLDAGHTDVVVELARDQLEQEFVADQAAYSFASWDDFLEERRAVTKAWRPALEERYRAGMHEVDGRIVPRASARAGAWAYYGIALEPPSSTHAKLAPHVLLLLASENDTGEAVERFRSAVPGAVIRTIESRHDLLADAPAETVAIVADGLG